MKARNGLTQPEVVTRTEWAVWEENRYCSILRGLCKSRAQAIDFAKRIGEYPQDRRTGGITIKETITTTVRWSPELTGDRP